MEPIKQGIRSVLAIYPRWVCRREYRQQRFNRFNERPIELAFLFRQLASLYPKTVLDVGTGLTAVPHLMRSCGAVVSAIDNIEDYWPRGMHNRHFHVMNENICNPTLTDRFDFITCISVLEHIDEADRAMAGMFGLLRPGGHLVVTCPYQEQEYVRNVYELPGSSYGQDAPYITQAYSREQLDAWTTGTGFELIEQEFWRFWTGKHWTQNEQVIPPEPSSADEPHQLTCLLFKKPD